MLSAHLIVSWFRMILLVRLSQTLATTTFAAIFAVADLDEEKDLSKTGDRIDMLEGITYHSGLLVVGETFRVFDVFERRNRLFVLCIPDSDRIQFLSLTQIPIDDVNDQRSVISSKLKSNN